MSNHSDKTTKGDTDGDLENRSVSTEAGNNQVADLSEVIASVSKQLPWPKDIFGEVVRGSDDWRKINEFAEKELGYPIDRISATLCRMGWANYKRLLQERVNDLVESGFVITTSVTNPQGEEEKV